jgi:predicted nuclease with TOPRIM domain
VRLLKDNVQKLEDKCKEVTEKMEEQVHLNTVWEEKVKRIESRQDSHSKKYDELMSTINELKIEMVRQFSRLTSELNAFNSMVEASDKGVSIIKNKKG